MGNNNDLIRRGDVERIIVEGLNNKTYGYDAVCILADLRDIHAAEQPMSAVDYIKARIRAEKAIRAECSRRASTVLTYMFEDKSVKIECCSNGCSNCDVYFLQFSQDAEERNPDEIVARVQRWAQEHPERSEECST